MLAQDIVRIDQSIADKSIRKLPSLVSAFDRAKAGNGRLHLLGLVSDGGVHSHIDHLFALLEAAKEAKVPHTFIHFFGDGRDTKPRSAGSFLFFSSIHKTFWLKISALIWDLIVTYIEQLQEFVKKLEYGSIATAVGRYYAMDRDKRWERVQVAFDALVSGKGEEAPTSSRQLMRSTKRMRRTSS